MILHDRLKARSAYLPLPAKLRRKIAARVGNLLARNENATKADVRREIEGVVGSPWMVWLALQLLWPLVLEWLRERRSVE
jgi:hypothetical protein